MADGSAPEVSLPQPSKAESRSSKIWKSIRETFRKKPSGQSAEINVSGEPILQTHSVEKPPESINPETKITTPETKESLRPAMKLLFHTTPNSRLNGIKNQGLLARGSSQNVGETLGYSLYFAEEHQSGTKGKDYRDRKMEDKLKDLSEDYSLSVWGKNPDLVKGQEGLAKEARFYTIKPKTIETADINTFFGAIADSNPLMGMLEPDMIKHGIGTNLRKLSPEYLTAIINLNKSTREEILNVMVLAERASITADQMEIRLKNFFTHNRPELLGAMDIDTLVHGLVGSIEQSLIRAAVTARITQVKDLQLSKQGVPLGLFEDSLAVVFHMGKAVNDPVSARYLISAENYLRDTITGSGLEVEKEVKIAQGRADSFSNEGSKRGYFSLMDTDNLEAGLKYYGGSNTEYAAYLMKKEMGLMS